MSNTEEGQYSHHVLSGRVGAWSFFSYLDEVASKDLVNHIVQRDVSIEHTFRDNWRTLSAQILFDGKPLLLKVPRARNGRRWERLLSLFRGSDSVRMFRHCEKMATLGLAAPEPVIAGELRQYGMVTDSFLCYRFVNGRRPTKTDAPLVWSALKSLHRKGYVRSDAQLANFLIRRDGTVVFIDFRLKRPCLLLALQQARELDRFLRSCPEARSLMTAEEQSSSWFRLAHALENLSFARRRWKRYFRDRRKARAGHR